LEAEVRKVQNTSQCIGLLGAYRSVVRVERSLTTWNCITHNGLPLFTTISADYGLLNLCLKSK